MRFAAITLIGFTTLIAAADTASARDGCGRGRAWNGYACVPDPYYAPPPPPPITGPYYRPGYGGGYGGYYEPPCDPGKHRAIVNGNSQCVYGHGGYRQGRYHGRYAPPCEPGKQRVIVNGNSQCR